MARNVGRGIARSLRIGQDDILQTYRIFAHRHIIIYSHCQVQHGAAIAGEGGVGH